MKHWNDSRDLLELFSIPHNTWTERFMSLCDMGAILRKFGGDAQLGELAREFMREYRVSPLVYWSNMKRVLRPLFEAGGDTLRALGLPVIEDPLSVIELARAVVEVTYQDVPESDRDIFDQLREIAGRWQR